MSQSQSTAAHRPVDSTEACQMDFWHLSEDKARKANYLSNLALYVEIDEADPVASAIGHWLIVCTIKRGLKLHPTPKDRDPRSLIESREVWLYCTPRRSTKAPPKGYGTYCIDYQIMINIVHCGEIQSVVLKKAHHPIPKKGLPLYPADFYRLCQSYPALKAAHYKVVKKWGPTFVLEMPEKHKTPKIQLAVGITGSVIGTVFSGLTGLFSWMVTGVGSPLLKVSGPSKAVASVGTVQVAKKICLGNETPTLATVGAQKTGTAMTPDTVVVKPTTRQEAMPKTGLDGFKVDSYVPRAPKGLNQYYARLLCPSCNGCGTIVKRLRDPTESGPVALGKRKRLETVQES